MDFDDRLPCFYDAAEKLREGLEESHSQEVRAAVLEAGEKVSFLVQLY